jgi:hypothetical protein
MTTTTMPRWLKDLRRLDACDEAIDWAKTQPGPDAAWAACERGDWLAWYAGRLSGEPESAARRPLVLCLCDVWRQLVPSERQRGPALACVEAAEQWARGEGTIVQLIQARDAAYAAAADTAAAYTAAAAAAAAADTAAAAYATAAYAAAAAAYTTAAAAYTTAAAAYTAAAAAYTAAAAAYTAAAAARLDALRRAADIVRGWYAVRDGELVCLRTIN